MSKGRLRLLAGGLMAILLLLVGCGGGDDTTSITKSEFLKQGNAVCKVQNQKREKAIQETIGNGSEKFTDARKKELLLEIIPFYEEATEELQALGLPAGDEEKIEAILAAREKAAKETKADLDEAITTRSQYEAANELSAKYGLSSCYT